MADIPPDLVCLDQERFLLVVPVSLPADLRIAAVRLTFAAAGQEQDNGYGAICLCGLDAEIPRPRTCREVASALITKVSRLLMVDPWTALFVIASRVTGQS
jgi:hypothetical protein